MTKVHDSHNQFNFKIINVSIYSRITMEFTQED